MIIGRNFAEKLYSENQEEKLYSTGNEELDALLEKAFCDGYELGQKEFAYKAPESLKGPAYRKAISVLNNTYKDELKELGWNTTTTNPKVHERGAANLIKRITKEDPSYNNKQAIRGIAKKGDPAGVGTGRLYPGKIKLIKNGLI